MTFRLAMAGLAAAGLLLVACGGGSSDGDDATTAPADTPTAEATATATTPPATPTPSALSEADLRPLVLRAEEIGAGWYESPATEDDENEDSEFCGTPGAEDEALAGYVAMIEADFELSAEGPWTTHTLISYSGDEARNAFDRISQLYASCKEWSETDEDGSVWDWVVYEYYEARFPQESRYLQLDAYMNGQPAAWIDVLFWRRDSVISMVWYSELIGVPIGDWQWPESLYDTLEERVRAGVR